jgi:effector-binding domain-containing protein
MVDAKERSTTMPKTPKIVERADQPYVGIRTNVTMQQIGEKLPPLLGEVFGWLDARGITPAGAPFFKYNVIDMAGELEIEVGVPLASTVAGDDRVMNGVLPAGRYVSMWHIGHPDGLYEATSRLLAWGKEHGVKWDASDDQTHWGVRLEAYEDDPDDEPDLDKWLTELRFRLAD